MTRLTPVGAAMALAMTAAGFAGAEEDATPGASVRPPADAEAGASVTETAVPAEDRETRSGSDLPGDTMDPVGKDSAAAPGETGDTEAPAEDQAAMERTDENAEAVRRYIDSLSEKPAPASAKDED